MNLSEALFFILFFVIVLSVLAIDLGIFNKREHAIGYREATAWTLAWMFLAGCFALGLLLWGDKLHGITNWEQLIGTTGRYKQKGFLVIGDFAQSLINYKKTIVGEFITGYLVELSLSLDNLFVILLVFTSFGIDKKHFHRVLFWGILGAVVFRFIFIFAGSLLIRHFAWTLYVFGLFLIYSGFKMFFEKEKTEIETDKHPIVKWASRNFRVWEKLEGKAFFVFNEGKRYITPLFLVLLIVETTDIVFAVDSIPAIFSITKDPYIIFFSNIFAILGLRSLFFLIANVIGHFHYFNKGLAFLLGFIGIKMLLEDQLQAMGFTTLHSLLVIVGILAISMLASVIFPEKKEVA